MTVGSGRFRAQERERKRGREEKRERKRETIRYEKREGQEQRIEEDGKKQYRFVLITSDQFV